MVRHGHRLDQPGPPQRRRRHSAHQVRRTPGQARRAHGHAGLRGAHQRAGRRLVGAPSNGSAITGYRLRYRAEGDSAWTTQTLGAATTARLSGLASATVYEAQVRAVNTLGAGPWSDTGTGATATPNGAPVFPLPGSPLSRSVAENSPAGTAVGGPVEATDPEGDALTYAISGAAEFTIDSATGQIRVAQGADIDYESVSSYTVTVTVTDGLDALGNADSSADDSKQVNISVIDVDETEPVTPDVSEPEVEQQAEPEQQAESAVELEEPRPNAAPSLSAPAGLEVAENSPASTAVGDPVPATDPEGDTLTFALSGAAEFSIDPATGQITVAAGAALDHESASSYTVTVTVSDGLDAAGNADPSADDSAQIAIAVTDVDEPPARPGAPSLTRDRNSPTSKLIVAWDAPSNAGGPAITGYDLRYRAKGAADWTDQPVSGTATTAAIGGLEPGTAYEAQVRAINDEGAGPWSEPGSGSTARPFGKTVYPFHEGGIAKVTATTPAPQPAEEKAPAVEPTPTPAPTPTASPVQSGLRVINPSDKNYRQGETIQSFNVIVFGGPTTRSPCPACPTGSPTPPAPSAAPSPPTPRRATTRSPSPPPTPSASERPASSPSPSPSRAPASSSSGCSRCRSGSCRSSPHRSFCSCSHTGDGGPGAPRPPSDRRPLAPDDALDGPAAVRRH